MRELVAAWDWLTVFQSRRERQSLLARPDTVADHDEAHASIA
jgi:hypothetical protein